MGTGVVGRWFLPGIRFAATLIAVFVVTTDLLAASWSQRWVGGEQVWSLGTVDRFKWNTGARQWWAQGKVGGWQVLTTAGYTGTFVGDEVLHDLGNGFSYLYKSANDQGWFKKGTAFRFFYCYGLSRWAGTGTYGGWQWLGNTNVSAAFLGDGGPHDLSNGFTYVYDKTKDQAFFKKGTAYRFFYCYAPSRWAGTGTYGGWQWLGNTNVSAAFLGDGGPHDLSNGFTYVYDKTKDQAFFKKGTAYRFFYCYAPSRWASAGTYGGWQWLGDAGLSASFLGDGSWKTVSTVAQFEWQYKYIAGEDRGYWKRPAADPGDWRFAYQYGVGEWRHKGAYGQGFINTYAVGGDSAAFLGDGAHHTLVSGIGVKFAVDGGEDKTGFYWKGNLRFEYYYGTGTWNHKSDVGGATRPIGSSTLPATLIFTGDQFYSVGGDFEYKFCGNLGPGGEGRWKYKGSEIFAFHYADGIWEHRGFDGTWLELKGAGSEIFVPGFTPSDYKWAVNGTWYYYFEGGYGYWCRYGLRSSANNRFRYNYLTGVWDHFDVGDRWVKMSDAGIAPPTYRLYRNEWFEPNHHGKWRLLYSVQYDQLRVQFKDATGNWISPNNAVGTYLTYGYPTHRWYFWGNHDGGGWQVYAVACPGNGHPFGLIVAETNNWLFEQLDPELCAFWTQEIKLCFADFPKPADFRDGGSHPIEYSWGDLWYYTYCEGWDWGTDFVLAYDFSTWLCWFSPPVYLVFWDGYAQGIAEGGPGEPQRPNQLLYYQP